MVYHSVTLDVQKNTSSCILDIIEKDKNSHQLLIKLVCNDYYYDISDCTPEIEFYDTETKSVVTTKVIDIVNPCRGYLSYVVGERILTNPSRYTVTLRLYQNDGTARLSLTFILNVIKDSSQSKDCQSSSEVAISEEFYEELKSHLDNEIVHLTDSDRVVLSYLTDNLNNLVLVKDLEEVYRQIEELRELIKD